MAGGEKSANMSRYSLNHPSSAQITTSHSGQMSRKNRAPDTLNSDSRTKEEAGGLSEGKEDAPATLATAHLQQSFQAHIVLAAYGSIYSRHISRSQFPPVSSLSMSV